MDCSAARLGRRALSLALAALFAGAAAAGAAEAPPADAPLQLTYAKSLEMAREQNPALQQARLDYEHASLAYKQAQGESSTRIALLQAEAAFKQAEQAWAEAQDQLVIDTMNAYFNALNAANQVQIATEALEQAETQLEIVQAKVAQGLAAQRDLLTAERDALTARANLEAARHDQTLARLTLARTLGLPLDTDFELEPADLTVEPFTMTEAEALEMARANEAILRAPMTALQIAELELQAASIGSTPAVTEQMLQNRYEKAQNALEIARVQLEIDARSRYYDVKEKEASIPAAAKAVEEAQEAYRITSLRVESGLDIPQALSQAATRLTHENQAHTTAIFQYTVARLTFLRWLGVE
ncbi:MAG TPA: TolC family protein [Limnochordia bacterium]